MIPSWENVRECVQLLNARAMLKLGEDNPDDAWLDVAASHRIARLCAQGPTNVSMLVAAAVESMTCLCDDQISFHRNVNSEMCRTYLAELLTIGPISGMAMEFRVGEAKLASAFVRHAVERILIDWNAILKQSNKWSDRFTAATRLPTRKDRQPELLRFYLELQDAGKHSIDLCRTTKPKLQEGVSEIVGNMLLMSTLLPPQAYDVGDRCIMRTQLSYCSFALAAWKSDEGTYPDAMTQLVPEYLKAIPIDEFTGQALIYRKTRDRYCLYSVGPNLKDDGGFTANDTNEADDIAVRTPDEEERIQADRLPGPPIR